MKRSKVTQNLGNILTVRLMRNYLIIVTFITYRYAVFRTFSASGFPCCRPHQLFGPNVKKPDFKLTFSSSVIMINLPTRGKFFIFLVKTKIGQCNKFRCFLLQNVCHVLLVCTFLFVCITCF